MIRVRGDNELRARMARTPSASPEDARRTNRSLVLRALHLGGPASRAGLAKLIRVTPATVSSVVRELVDEEIVEELGRSEERNVGKPATLVGIRSDGRNIASIDLSSHDELVGALIDLDGKVVARHRIERHGAVAADLLVLVRELFAELVGAAQRPLLGVGVATPGYVEASGIVATATRLHWERVDVARELSAIGPAPVHVVNDANAAALAELTYGDGDNQDLVVVRIDEGVGAGLVLDGTLHIGRAGGGGELGHVVLDPNGAPCECGKRGCLETFVSAPLIHYRLRHDVGAEPDGSVIVDAGRALGQGLALLLSALDVAHVVVSGTEEVLSEPFRAAVHEVVAARTLPDFARRLAIRESSFHDHDVLLGAAALVLDRELGIR